MYHLSDSCCPGSKTARVGNLLSGFATHALSDITNHIFRQFVKFVSEDSNEGDILLHYHKVLILAYSIEIYIRGYEEDFQREMLRSNNK